MDAEGGTKADLWDVVILNAALEIGYYTAVVDGRAKSAGARQVQRLRGHRTLHARRPPGDRPQQLVRLSRRCALERGVRHPPGAGHRILMDGYQLIHSGDDFGVNSAGMAITENAITFKGFDPNGVPEFVRARKAMQYAASIDDFDRIMRDGNNGGYANAWLVADLNTGEIARLELGLRNVTLERTKDGYFVGTNFPVSRKLAAEETTFKLDDPGLQRERPARARRAADGGRRRKARHRSRGREGLLPTTTTRTRGRRPPRASARCAATWTSRRARHGRLVRALRAGGHGASEGRGRRDGEADVVRGGDGPPVQPRGLPRGGAPREAPRARLDEAAAARPRRAARPWTAFTAEGR